MNLLIQVSQWVTSTAFSGPLSIRRNLEFEDVSSPMISSISSLYLVMSESKSDRGRFWFL